ncbi:MAG: hypothetical protein AAGI70_09315, partial [Pseudomonadota bacterium]
LQTAEPLRAYTEAPGRMLLRPRACDNLYQECPLDLVARSFQGEIAHPLGEVVNGQDGVPIDLCRSSLHLFLRAIKNVYIAYE